MYSLEPFSPCKYPSKLESIRTSILPELSHLPHEVVRIAGCKGSSLQCRSSFCPSCQRNKAYRAKLDTLGAASQVDPSRLKFATFKTRDVPIDQLRETGRMVVQAGSNALRKLGVPGYSSRLEVSFESWQDNYHPHLHAIVDTPGGGRRFIPVDRWENAWLSALPPPLHPREVAANVAPIRNLDSTCSYLNKSPFFDIAGSSTVQIRRTLAVIEETKGLRRRAMHGIFAERAHCAEHRLAA